MENSIESIYKLYVNDSNLTQQELEKLYYHFDQLADLLYPLGNIFELARREAVEVRNKLNGMQKERNGHYFA